MSFDQPSLFWLIAMVVLLVIEGCTVNLVSIWFAIGACAALITSLLCGSIGIQLAVFAVVSLVALALTKPLVARLRRATPDAPTNGDRNVGREGTVIEEITPGQRGRVRLDGVDWAARCEEGCSLAKGAQCRVVRIDSTVLVVVPAVQPAVVQ
jgi:membrane protein implicated in regulation of membrane protease activity